MHLQATCSGLCPNYDGIWDESPHGGRQVSTINYGGKVTFLPFFHSYILWHLTSDPPVYCNLFTHYCFVSTQALQKICVASHIHSLAELLHADTVQQLELALLGLLVARILDILAMATKSQIPSTHLSLALLCPSTTPSVSVSSPLVHIVGVTETEESPIAEASTSKKTPPPTTSADIEAVSPKCQRIIPTLIPVTTSKTSSSAFKLPFVVVPELVVPAYALPEQINHPGGCKDYKCQLCAFQHMNKDCMLMHIQQHLEILVGCPMCVKGFQNVASLCKHGRKVHSIQIVETENK